MSECRENDNIDMSDCREDDMSECIENDMGDCGDAAHDMNDFRNQSINDERGLGYEW